MELQVLIVDDELGLQEVINDFVSLKGFTTKTASSAQEALEILETCTPYLIICDISMPGMNGLELMEKVKSNGLKSAVVMLTAHEESDKIIRAVQLGCIDYMTKPFDSKVFLSKLDSWVEIGKRLLALNSESSTSERGDVSRQLKMIDMFRMKNAKTQG